MQVLNEHDGRPFGDELLHELDPAGVQAVARRQRVEVATDIEIEREAQNLALPQPLAHDLRGVTSRIPKCSLRISPTGQ